MLNSTPRTYLVWSFSALAFIAVAMTAWIIPLRMYFGNNGSYFTFVHMYDELIYAGRIQPLVAGATCANPVNGIGDPRYISQFFLEDSVRAVLTLLHLDVITAFWLWRALFPIAVMASLYLLAGECVPQCARVSGAALRVAAAALGAALLSLEPLVVYSPPQGWSERVPTNIEYPLSILMAWFYLRALRKPSPLRAALLSLCLVATVYWRFYLAIPWAIALAGGAMALFIQRRFGIRTFLATIGILVAAMSPWLAIVVSNSRLPVNTELMYRYFTFAESSVRVHPYWEFYVRMAGAIAIAGMLLRGNSRIICITTGAGLCITPFIYRFFPMRSELLGFNRLSSFYLTAALTALLLCIGAAAGARRWRQTGTRGAWVVLLACSLAVSGVMSLRNSRYAFAEEEGSEYTAAQQEIPFIPALNWIRNNTPEDALFFTDDGCDMSRMGFSDELGIFISSGVGRFGLFPIVARRRCVFNGKLFVSNISTRELAELAQLHWTTLGYPGDQKVWAQLLKRYHPDYIIWRKSNPQLQAAASRLGSLCTPVYSDAAAEVWKMDVDAMTP